MYILQQRAYLIACDFSFGKISETSNLSYYLIKFTKNQTQLNIAQKRCA